MTPSILVVEDEFIVSAEIEERLIAMVFHITGSADTGEQAIELVRQGHPDLVLMDIRLKGEMDGITAAATIRHQFHLPIIFLTAYSEDSTLERAKLVEPYGYILKPFDDRELKSTIEIALYRHKAEQEILRLNRLYNVLSQVNQAVVRTQSQEDLLQNVCRLIVERGDVDVAWIERFDPETGQTRRVAHYGKQSELIIKTRSTDDGLSEVVDLIDRQQFETAFVSNNCIQHNCPAQAGCVGIRLGLRSCGWFPLHVNGHLFGILRIGVSEANFFQEREKELLKEVALDLSFALEKMEGDAQRNQAEVELRKSEEQLTTMFEMAPIGIAQVEPSTGRYLRVNQKFADMTGYSPGELKGLNFSDLTYPEDRANDWETFTQLVNDRIQEYRVEKRYLVKSGAILWANVNVTVIRDVGGQPKYVLAMIEDITERKRMEVDKKRVDEQLRQAHKMEAIGHLAGGIAHDFNNILSAILGYTEMAIESHPEDNRLRKDLTKVYSAGLRAKDLVQQILTFSRQSAHEPQPVELIILVKEVVKMLRATLPSSINIYQKNNISSQQKVLADPTQLHQVIMNLCTNAAHSMRATGGNLTIELQEITLAKDTLYPAVNLSPGRYIQLLVTDTGQGMSEEVIAHIFDPFFTTKPQGEGTGMGLSVVHGIVRNCNGAITVNSKEGAGTTFCVYLPELTSQTTESDQAAPSLIGGKGHILFVDDEVPLMELGPKKLERMGYTVTTTNNSQEALHIMQSKPRGFDLLITDYTMPHMTGLELAKAAKRINPEMPVIICSGHSNEINEKTAATFGIEAFLQKPFQWNTFSRIISMVLQGMTPDDSQSSSTSS